ncbi:type II restriction endonuclease [Prevotella pectinovora]|uniref:type II restriction endonuclease n=1 Tax=Prevotella pectinovora TaxID=1602169 RepID=UPI002FDB0FDE
MTQEEKFSVFFDNITEIKIGLDYYTDFNKVINNIKTISLRLTQLNYLIGQKDMRKAVEELWEENPKVFSVMGILVAVRKKQNKKAWGRDGSKRLVYNYFDCVDHIMEFIEDSGLLTVLQDKHIKNLVDYVFGVETGLDTHGRKNRIGEIMASKIAQQFDEANISYEREVQSKKIPAIKLVLGKDSKRFDFVISCPNKKYLVEVNYYGTQGSKVTEIPRSYMDVAKKINSVKGFEFVWITDGPGWEKAKEQLNEAYDEIPNVYNLKTLQDFIDKILTNTKI